LIKSPPRLRGKSIFLSASVPAEGSGFHRLDLYVDEAVMTLARTVFAEGGQLVFGGHPSISPLVLTIASEYAGLHERSEPMALIYQSTIFSSIIPEKTSMMETMGYGRIVWTPAAEGEVLRRDQATGRYIVPKSLEIMRRQMIAETMPVAFVAAGGMEGVEDEVRIFRELRPAGRVYALAETGGVAAQLAVKYDDVVEMDKRVKERLGEYADDRPSALYPIVMEQIVGQLSENNS